MTHYLAVYLTLLHQVCEAQGGSTNFLQPGKPVKGEEEDHQEISGFKRFLHKLGVDLDPSDVIVGLVILCAIGVAAWFFM